MRINLNFLIIALFSFILLCSCGTTKKMVEDTGDPVWIDLFNGKDLSNWTAKIHHYETGDNHANTFRVEDEMIRVNYDDYRGDFADRFGHLYYDTPYSYYHLSLEYRFVGEWESTAPIYTLLNSGIMFHSQDPRTMPKEQNWPISVEMQFLAGVEEGQERPTGNMCSPGTEVFYNGEMYPGHCLNSSSDTYFGDQWVKADLIVLGDSLVTHMINGKVVLMYEKPQIGGEVVMQYDPEIKIDGKLLESGFIALQSEGQPIDFRNIRLMNLKGCMDTNAKNYGKHFIESDPGSCKY